MAKCKNPFGAIEARGSVGGITASRNSFGAILRAKASPVQPRTQAQQARRYSMQKLTRAFQDLTVAQIGDWNDFAANWTVTDVFGDAMHLTGLDWYVSLNSRLLAAVETAIATPPLNPNSLFSNTVSIYQQAVSNGDIKMKLNVSIPTGYHLFLSYSSNLPKSSNFLKKSCKQRAIFGSTLSLTHTLLDFTALSPDDSCRQFTWFGIDDSGRATPVQRATVYPT